MPSPAPHARSPGSSSGSAVWPASASGSPLCSPCGRPVSSSTAGAAHCGGPGETIAGSSDTYVVFASSSAGILQPPIMRASTPDRDVRRRRAEENEETFIGSFWKKTPPKKTTVSHRWNDYTFRSVMAVFFCVLAFLLRIIEPWWENLWESNGLSLRFPRCDLVAIPAVTVVAIVVFFLTIDVDSLAMILFFHFLVISIYGRFAFRVAKRYQEYGSEYESISRAIMHVGAFVLLSSTSFGWLQYGHVTSSLGGGQGQSVEVLVVDASVSKGLESMGFEV